MISNMGYLKKEKIKNILENNTLLAFLINLFFFTLVIFLCDIKYEVSDDFVMSAILSGGFGDTQNPQMIFVNVGIGYLLRPLYILFPKVSWYFVAQLILVFLSSTTITYLLLRRLEKAKALLLSFMLILYFSNDAYILVQFTKTAMFAIMAGGIYFIWALFEERKTLEILWGALLCITGSMVRFADIYLAGGFFLLILSYEFLRLFVTEKDKKKLKTKFLKISVNGIVLIALAFGINALSTYTYHNDEPYSYFSDYSTARANIVDYADYGYGAYSDKLKLIGISENDYNVIRSWNFADNNIFSLEKLQEVGKIIADYPENNKIDLDDILDTLGIRGILRYPCSIICILVFVLGLFWNYKKWWTAVLASGIGFSYIIYFVVRGRNVYRTEFAVFLGIFICCVYFWERQNNMSAKFEHIYLYTIQEIKRSTIICIIICLSACYLYIPDQSYKKITSDERQSYINSVFYQSWDYNSRKYRRVVNKAKPQNDLLMEFENHKENFYFLDFNTTIQTLYFEWSPWEALSIGYFNNFTYLAGVTTNFPDIVNLLDKKDLLNPLQSLVKENVYLVDNQSLEVKLNFLKEHYYPNAWSELYKEVNGYQIWKIHEN